MSITPGKLDVLMLDASICWWPNPLSTLLDACELHNPVGFSGAAPIRRKCLLPLAPVFAQVRPDEADKDLLALKGFLVIKEATPLLELAKHWRLQAADQTICPMDAPLLKYAREEKHSGAK
jgi:hypothetical protein